MGIKEKMTWRAFTAPMQVVLINSLLRPTKNICRNAKHIPFVPKEIGVGICGDLWRFTYSVVLFAFLMIISVTAPISGLLLLGVYAFTVKTNNERR